MSWCDIRCCEWTLLWNLPHERSTSCNSSLIRIVQIRRARPRSAGRHVHPQSAVCRILTATTTIQQYIG